MSRPLPNILVTGTPGVGKTSHCEALVSSLSSLEPTSASSLVSSSAAAAAAAAAPGPGPGPAGDESRGGDGMPSKDGTIKPSSSSSSYSFFPTPLPLPLPLSSPHCSLAPPAKSLPTTRITFANHSAQDELLHQQRTRTDL